MLRLPSTARLLIAAAFISVTTVACSSSPTAPVVTQARTRLIGTWNFLRTCGGIAGQCSNTSNMPTRYVFRGDDSVEAYRDGQRLFTLNYQLAPGAADSTLGDTRP